MFRKIGIISLLLVSLAGYSVACEILTEGLPWFFYGQTYSIQLEAYGAAPFTYTVYSGSLPPGLSMNSSGLITGSPTQTSYYNNTFCVTMTDANGCHQTQCYDVSSSN
jgi:hypothetical protein